MPAKRADERKRGAPATVSAPGQALVPAAGTKLTIGQTITMHGGWRMYKDWGIKLCFYQIVFQFTYKKLIKPTDQRQSKPETNEVLIKTNDEYQTG